VSRTTCVRPSVVCPPPLLVPDFPLHPSQAHVLPMFHRFIPFRSNKELDLICNRRLLLLMRPFPPNGEELAAFHARYRLLAPEYLMTSLVSFAADPGRPPTASSSENSCRISRPGDAEVVSVRPAPSGYRLHPTPIGCSFFLDRHDQGCSPQTYNAISLQPPFCIDSKR